MKVYVIYFDGEPTRQRPYKRLGDAKAMVTRLSRRRGPDGYEIRVLDSAQPSEILYPMFGGDWGPL